MKPPSFFSKWHLKAQYNFPLFFVAPIQETATSISSPFAKAPLHTMSSSKNEDFQRIFSGRSKKPIP
jgi:hypothetical protein